MSEINTYALSVKRDEKGLQIKLDGYGKDLLEGYAYLTDALIKNGTPKELLEATFAVGLELTEIMGMCEDEDDKS